MRDWVTNVRTTHYLLGSVLGAHPYPTMVRDFHRVIGEEARKQILKAEAKLPTAIIACVGGGSNAIGIFHAFLNDPGVALIGVEAGGRGHSLGEHAARFGTRRHSLNNPAEAMEPEGSSITPNHSAAGSESKGGSPDGGGSPGVLQGTYSYLLQDSAGQVALTHSVSAGLDYPAIGPEHAWLHDQGRAEYVSADDKEALDALRQLAHLEGIIPALESAHAVAECIKRAPKMSESGCSDRQHLRPRRQGHRNSAGESGAVTLGCHHERSEGSAVSRVTQYLGVPHPFASFAKGWERSS